MVGLVDCNNFFVSCERVFNPGLEGRPVAVLSNNDGCVVARSPEFKKLNIPMGTPYFKLKPLAELLDMVFISSNYTLYGDMSHRVMSVLRQFTPRVEQYSIDEAFVHFNLPGDTGYEELGISLRERIRRWVGLATGVGFARTRTLAKLACELAKKKMVSGVYVMPQPADDVLADVPVGDVWGVGTRVERHLKDCGIRTALQLAHLDMSWIQRKFSVCLARTALELRGLDVLPAENFAHPLKSTTCSRAFGVPVVDFGELRESVAEYAEMAARHMREQGRLAAGATVFFQWNAGLPPGEKEGVNFEASELTVVFKRPTNNTAEIFAAVSPHLESIYECGRRYRKSGIIFFGLEGGAQLQPGLFAESRPSPIPDALYKAMDALNRQYGRDAVHCLASGLERPWAMRRNRLSSQYTTDWDGLMVARC